VLAALHTWGRTLSLPPHVHCLVTGGGLDAQGDWRSSTNGYLLPVAVVRKLFRGTVLGELEALWATGQLLFPPHLDDDSLRQVWVEAARQKWHVRIAERYPHGRGVAVYLARYVRGGPLKDHRLVSFDGQRVTLRYGNHRQLDAPGKPRPQALTLSVEEFLHRWSEHVPLPGVHMIRAWGLYASAPRPKLERCREQLSENEPPRESPRELEEAPRRDHPWENCPVCQQRMVVTQVLPRAGAPPPSLPRVEAA